jgi:hypothetical protein
MTANGLKRSETLTAFVKNVVFMDSGLSLSLAPE